MNAKAIALCGLPLLLLLLYKPAPKEEWKKPPEGPPLPPDLPAWPNVLRIPQGYRVPAGWWWYWFVPSEAAGLDAVFQKNRDRVRIEKTWGDDEKGHVVLFESLGNGLLWTLSRVPIPAPRGADTSFPDLTQLPPAGEGPPSAFRRWLEEVSGEAWQVLVDEWERLKRSEPRQPFQWPWDS